MGLLKRIRARTMGLSQRQYEIIDYLHPHFVENEFLQGHPGVSMQILAGFADEHGKRIEQLTNAEVDDFVDLLKGIHFLISPDRMARANKYGCEQCHAVYVELWKLATEQIDDYLKSGRKVPDLTPEQEERLINQLAEQEKFLGS